MDSRLSSIFLALVWIVVAGLSACSKVERGHQDATAAMPQTSPARSLSKLDEIKKQIEVFASYGGQEGEAAKKALEAYPSEELTADIEILRVQSGEDEIFKAQLAFVLCFFRHDYETNKNKITEALRASRNDRRFDSVGAQSMIRELIRRGDSTLLSGLFNAATWSDGALSEGLATTFSEQLVNNPSGFLMTLGRVSIDTRRGVYRLIDRSSFSEAEITELKKYLASEKIPSSERSIAKELSSKLRSD
jgi:hypothetical protein